MSIGKRIAPLDGLRTFAAFGVVWIHSWTFAGNPSLRLHGIDFYRCIAILGNGVDFFFVISGFFMCLVLNKKDFSGKEYLNFIFNRWKRIAPAFYFSAIAYSIYFFARDNQYPFFNNLFFNFTFLHNIFGTSIISPYWSLGTEWHFYLLLPFLFWGDSKKYILKRVAVFSLVSIFFLYLINKGILLESFWKVQIFPRFIEFGWGCIAAYLYSNSIQLPKWMRGTRGILLSLVITYVGRLCMTTEIVDKALKYGWVLKTFSEPIMTFGYAWFMYIMVMEITWLSKFLSRPIFNFFGKLSYSVYLWHAFALLIMGQLQFKASSNPAINSLLIFFIVSTITIFIAYFSYKFLEEPYFKRKNQ